MEVSEALLITVVNVKVYDLQSGQRHRSRDGKTTLCGKVIREEQFWSYDTHGKVYGKCQCCEERK